jgi:hypothetical protein
MSIVRRRFIKSAIGAMGALAAPVGGASYLLSGESRLLAAADTSHFDLVVYGSTPSGIMTAVAASRQGLHVALLDNAAHVGGMMTAGLCSTDQGNGDTIGGIAREFFERVGRRYNEPIVWAFEPHVAEGVFHQMLKEARVNVSLNERLREAHGVSKAGTLITHITMESGATFHAREFADCTYDGDLMNQAGVSNTWGRESAEQYNESLAGVLPTLRYDLQFSAKVSPYASDGSLLPGVSSLPRGKLGQGDKKVPAYNYRLCLSSDKANQVAYPRPDGYDAGRYELLAKYLPVLGKTRRRDLHLSDAFLIGPLRGNKADFNNFGAISTDYIGANWDYPTGSYKRKEEIVQELFAYEAGLLYFISHDLRVPTTLQKEINEWGLAKDEFTDTNNWPWRIYVRESRRMIGEYVFTQHDAQEHTTKTDSIGVGSYWLDSHNVQCVPTADGGVENEGDMFAKIDPYEIPYRSITPKRSEVTNLLVPVCMSASHAAYGTIRQEPVYMILGQATGVAAAIAAREHIDVQDVSLTKLQERLSAERALLYWHGSL